MPSITSWLRIEPRVRSADLNKGLQARVYDPLWLLARQWQVGEFQGEDNGSPVIAQLRATSSPLTHYRPGIISVQSSVPGREFDSHTQPLETIIERERVRQLPDQAEKLLLAAEAGLQFLRLLKQQNLKLDYREAYVRNYPFPTLTADQRTHMDLSSLRSYDLLASRVPDGARLYADWRRSLAQNAGDQITFPAEPSIDSDDSALVKEVAQLWVKWYEALFSDVTDPDSCWLNERIEYAFAVSGNTPTGEQVLVAREYYEGSLDWYAFNTISNVTITGNSANAVLPIISTTIPAPVSYRGMPAQRWWEFEDSQVDFGAIDAGPEDLARMMLIEFAMSFGNDWFMIPVEVEVGSLFQIQSLIVTDTFGGRFLIPSSKAGSVQHSAWRMFQLSAEEQATSSSSESAPNLFFLPPTLVKSLEGQPIEEVILFRDEMANMVWGVERVVEGPVGRPLNRNDAYFEQQAQHKSSAEDVPADTSASQSLRYRLLSNVPDHWIPLTPVQIDDTRRAIRLRRAVLLNQDGKPEFTQSQGRILTPQPGKPLELYEEEVPREGVRVTRSYQYTRWLDGSTHLWVGRRKQVGRGEGSSGLRFDFLDI